MLKQSLIKELLKRKVPQIIGSYFITGTTLVFFIQYLVDKYQFPSHHPTLALFALAGIFPSVVILAYSHGAPGKDEWTRIEKIGIPINVLFIAGILFFGDSLNLWKINNVITTEITQEKEEPKPIISLIHFTSLSEQIPHMKKHLILEDGVDLHPIDTFLLDSLRKYFTVQLLNWYFGGNNNFIIPMDDKDVNYLNNHPLLSVDLAFTEKRREDVKFWRNSADSIYQKFNGPNHIAYFNIYKSSANRDPHYQITKSYLRGNPNKGNNGNDAPVVKSISDLFDNIKSNIEDLLGAYKKIGFISEINDDIILVNLKDMNVRKNMELQGTSTYNYGPGNGGYKNRLEDLKNAIDYMDETNEHYGTDFVQYGKKYESLLEDSLYCMKFEDDKHVAGCVQTRGENYYLRVIKVMDTVAVTKVIKYKYPWVKIRINDFVYVTTN